MGETESRPVPIPSTPPEPARAKERELSGSKDGHVRLLEDRDAEGDAAAEELQPKGEAVVCVRCPDTVQKYNQDHLRKLLRTLQQSAQDWVISLEVKRTDNFAEQVTFYRKACATGHNPGLPIVDVAVVYVFEDCNSDLQLPVEHQEVVSCLNHFLNSHNNLHVRVRWDVISKSDMEKSALKLITF